MSQAEFETFETWYSSTVKDGSLSFYFYHPIKQAEVEVKSSGPYGFSIIGHETYEIKLGLIIL